MKRWIAVFLLMALLLGGCDQVQPPSTGSQPATITTTTPTTAPATQPEMEFTASFCNFGEAYGYTYDSKRSYMTVYRDVTYHFGGNTDKETRPEIVMECDRVIAMLQQAHPGYEPQLTVCFTGGDYAPRVLEHTLYIGTDQFKTPDMAIGLAQMFFGHHVNYGIVYACGIETARVCGYETEETPATQAEALMIYEKAPEYLDLNYACFRPEYAESKVLKRVKALAIYFYEWLCANEKLDLLTDYSDAKYSQYLSQYLTEHGKGEYDNSDLGGTIFYYGGPALRIVWENEDGIFYVNYDYKVQYQESHFKDDMLKSGYKNLRKLVVDYQAQADYIEGILGHLEKEDSRVDIQFTERFVSQMYTAAQYTEYYNLIEMFAAGPFLHEYTHYLLRDTEIDLWLNELVAYYFGYYPVSSQLSYQWEDQITYFKLVGSLNPYLEAEALLMQVLKEHLDHPLDWSDPADFEYVFSAYVVVTQSYVELTNPNGGGYAKYSFMSWLIAQAGQEATIDAIMNDTAEETFGKNWDQLRADWEAGLRAEYDWLREYFIID